MDKSGDVVSTLFSLKPTVKETGGSSEYERVAKTWERRDDEPSPTGEEAIAGPASQETAPAAEAALNPEGGTEQDSTEVDATPGANTARDGGQTEQAPTNAAARVSDAEPASTQKTAVQTLGKVQPGAQVAVEPNGNTATPQPVAKPAPSRVAGAAPIKTNLDEPEPEMPQSSSRHRLSTPQPAARAQTTQPAPTESPATRTAASSHATAHFARPEIAPHHVAEIAGHVRAIEILARRHNEAVARMNVQSAPNFDEPLRNVAAPGTDKPVLSKTAQRHLAAREQARTASPEQATRVATTAGVKSVRMEASATTTRLAGVKPNSEPTPTSAPLNAPRVAAPTAAPEPVAPPAPVDLSQRIERFQAFTQRLASRVAGMAAGGGGAAVIRLQPEFLGKMRVEVRVDQAAAGIQVVTDNPQVTRLLQTEQWWLRDALAQHGIALGQFDVRSGDPGAAFADRREAGEGSAAHVPNTGPETAAPSTAARQRWFDGRVSVMA